MDTITIRDARMADAENLFDLLGEFVVSYVPDRAAFDRELPKVLGSGDARLRVADLRGEAIGYVLAHCLDTFYANGPVIVIHELAVAMEHRGQGIGRLLIEDVLDAGRDAGCQEVVVSTRRAGGFYEQLGFAPTATNFKHRLGE